MVPQRSVLTSTPAFGAEIEQIATRVVESPRRGWRCALVAALIPVAAAAFGTAARAQENTAPPPVNAQSAAEMPPVDQLATNEQETGPKKKRVVPFDERPYKIKVLVSFSNDTQITPRLRGDVLRRYLSHAAAFVGDVWQLDVQDVSGTLAAFDADTIGALSAEKLGSYAAGQDKLFVLGARFEGDRFVLAARELDVFFSRWGPVFSGTARETTQIARELLILNSRMFSPLARMVSGDIKRAQIMVKGGKLPTLNKEAVDKKMVEMVGSVELNAVYQPSVDFLRTTPLFRPMRPVYRPPADPDDEPEIVGVKPMPWTLYSVERRDGALVDCRIISALKATLPPQSQDANDPELLMARSAGGMTKLRLVEPDNLSPLAALDVEVRDVVDGPSYSLGTTDPDGRIMIPQRRQGEGIVWAVVRHGRDTQAVLPILPGAGEEPELAIKPDQIRLDVEGKVVAVQEQIIDQVARRTILAGTKTPAGDMKGGLIQKARDKKEWKQAAELLKLLKVSPSKEMMTEKLEKVRTDTDEILERLGRKWPPKAKRMIDDTEAIIEAYFNPDEFLDIVEGYEDDIKNGAEEAGIVVDLGPPLPDTSAAPPPAANTPKAAP